jgi:polyphosphate kinase
MGRNLDRRIETLVSLEDQTHKNELSYILEKTFSDEFAHWSMDENDRWIYVSRDLSGVKLKDFQEHFLERYQND